MDDLHFMLQGLQEYDAEVEAREEARLARQAYLEALNDYLQHEDTDDEVEVEDDNSSLDSVLSNTSMASNQSEEDIQMAAEQARLLAEGLAARLNIEAAAAAGEEDDTDDEDEYIDVVDENDHEVAQILEQLSDSSDDSYNSSDDNSYDSSDDSSVASSDEFSHSDDDSSDDSEEESSESESDIETENEEDIEVPISSSDSEPEEPRVPPIYDPFVDYEPFVVTEDSGLDSSIETDNPDAPLQIGGVIDVVNDKFNIIIFEENGAKVVGEDQIQQLVHAMINDPDAFQKYFA